MPQSDESVSEDSIGEPPVADFLESRKDMQRAKTRARMVRLRQRVKQLPPDEQEAVKARARAARARYRANHPRSASARDPDSAPPEDSPPPPPAAALVSASIASTSGPRTCLVPSPASQPPPLIASASSVSYFRARRDGWRSDSSSPAAAAAASCPQSRSPLLAPPPPPLQLQSQRRPAAPPPPHDGAHTPTYVRLPAASAAAYPATPADTRTCRRKTKRSTSRGSARGGDNRGSAGNLVPLPLLAAAPAASAASARDVFLVSAVFLSGRSLRSEHRRQEIAVPQIEPPVQERGFELRRDGRVVDTPV
ncbi:unnamed protein product [Mycena citricolor]|uniref:Uncharacterized protein n=1 Tax=Mycena citricolor TaxID=2018698 RepID=A0AAD2JXU6_9AGAR|nr:unnamed protein product [Mycena citricolor]